ncbi:MAG: ribonuclease III [Chloroflexota bacterium]
MNLGGLVPESPLGFARRLGLPFERPLLIDRAMTHRSYLNEHPEALEDNERLEFLGDAVLDFLVGAWLYRHFPEKREGELTRLRSALVRTEQLAEFACQIDLGAIMRLGRGEWLGGGRENLVLLCAAFESLIGALYLEAGLEAVERFLEPRLKTAVVQILETHRDQDAKSHLQEYAQSQGMGTPAYRTIAASGPEHEKTFEVEVLLNGQVYGRGSGTSKRAATKAAARATLELLGID